MIYKINNYIATCTIRICLSFLSDTSREMFGNFPVTMKLHTNTHAMNQSAKIMNKINTQRLCSRGANYSAVGGEGGGGKFKDIQDRESLLLREGTKASS